jgi:hypothetical protein
MSCHLVKVSDVLQKSIAPIFSIVTREEASKGQAVFVSFMPISDWLIFILMIEEVHFSELSVVFHWPATNDIPED